MSRVLITAIGSFSADAVIRGCREMGYEIIGCDIYPMEWVANSIEVDVFYQAPRAADNQEAYINFINSLEADYIVPLTDVEVDILNANRDTLNGKLLLSDDKVLKLCRDKFEFGKVADGIETHFLPEEIPEKFPVVLKPVDGRSSIGKYVVKDKAYLDYILSSLTGRYIWQPYIEGPVITVDVCRHPKTNHVEVLAREELLRTYNGAGTSVKIVHDRYLETRCRELAKKLDIRGTVCFEFIREEIEAPVDGKGGKYNYHILECNPRFSGGVAFSCLAGYDFVAAHFAAFTMPDIPFMSKIHEQYFARKYVEFPM